MNDNASNLVSIVLDGGMYYYNRSSSVMVVLDGYDGLDAQSEPVLAIGRRKRVNLLMYPREGLREYGKTPAKAFIDSFLRLNLVPSFILFVKVMPSLIMKDDVQLLVDGAIDDGLMKKIASEGIPWLKMETSGGGNFLYKRANADIKRERGLLSTGILIKEGSLGNLGDLLDVLGKL